MLIVLLGWLNKGRHFFLCLNLFSNSFLQKIFFYCVLDAVLELGYNNEQINNSALWSLCCSWVGPQTR